MIHGEYGRLRAFFRLDRDQAIEKLLFVEFSDPHFVVLPSVSNPKVGAIDDVASWENDPDRFPIGSVGGATIEVFADDGMGTDLREVEGGRCRKGVGAHEVVEDFAAVGMGA